MLVTTSATLTGVIGVAPASAAPGDEFWFDRTGTYYCAAAEAVLVSSDGHTFATGIDTVNDSDEATGIALGPTERRVHVTGTSDDTISGADQATDVLVRPGGRRIYVLGTTATTKTGQDVVVIAYRGNGSRTWRHRFDGPTSGDDSVSSGALGSNGRHIDLTGGSDHDYLSLPYRRNGGQLWSGRYDGPAGGEDFATEASVAPDIRSLFVTGQSPGATNEDGRPPRTPLPVIDAGSPATTARAPTPPALSPSAPMAPLS